MAFSRRFRHTAVFTVLAPVGVMANAYAKISLGVSSIDYLGQGEVGRENTITTLDIGLDEKSQSDTIDSKALVQSQIGITDSDYRFVEFPEAYLETDPKLTGPYRVSVGRKQVPWSAIDDTWGTGTYEPQFRWDYLQPQEVGLLGIYQEFKTGIVKITGFYSPIFIPDRDAPVDFANGQITSSSPWAVNPPYEIQVLSTTVPVQYDAQVPPLGQIIRQNTYVGQVRVGEEFGPWADVTYAYKPMNQLLMSYTGQLGEDAYVTLYPRVAYHHVVSADVGIRNPGMTATLSAMADLPDDTTGFPALWTNQQVSNMYLVSPTVTLNPFRRESGGSFGLSYLHVTGADPADTGYFADGVTSQFVSRYPFTDAFLFNAALPNWHHLFVDFRFLYDFGNPGTIVSWYFTYVLPKGWKIFLSTDVLSSFSDGVNAGTDFIYRYRANDRVGGGVSYAF